MCLFPCFVFKQTVGGFERGWEVGGVREGGESSYPYIKTLIFFICPG